MGWAAVRGFAGPLYTSFSCQPSVSRGLLGTLKPTMGLHTLQSSWVQKETPFHAPGMRCADVICVLLRLQPRQWRAKQVFPFLRRQPLSLWSCLSAAAPHASAISLPRRARKRHASFSSTSWTQWVSAVTHKAVCQHLYIPAMPERRCHLMKARSDEMNV